MSADPHTIREWLYDSLSDLEDNLGAAGDDGRLLESLRMRIAAALSEHAGAEQEIRTVLQERYDDGHLRTETYEQVCGLLDRQVTEDLDTEPTGQLQPAGRHPVSELDLVTAQLDAAPAVEEDHYSTTTILHHEVQRLATADDQVQAGSVLRDRFLLQERVSGGSMGVVYKALDRRMAEAGASEPWVAIKVLSPQLAKNGTALRALQQEAAKGRCLSHANIVRFIDLDREDDLYFIVMEWLEGQTLAAILDSTEGKTMGTDQAMRIVRQLANALGYAHRCGIVHADVKPANVMIQPNGDVKLFDFGVARVRQSQKENQEDFDPGVLGALTPAYSSMQVLTGEDPAPADDVFSLGCLFYRLVAGYRVFGPRNAAEAAAEGMAPQRPQGLTEGQWRALKKAISYSRVTRFQSMNEFMAALEERVPVAGEPIEIGPAEDFEMEDAGGSRSWLVGLVALLLLLGFAVYQFGFSDRYPYDEQVQAWFEEQLAAFRDDAPAEGEAAGPVDPDAATRPEEDIVDLPADEGPPIAGVGETPPGEAAAEADEAAEAAEGTADAAASDAAAGDAETAPDSAGDDAASRPPADVDVVLTPGITEPDPVVVTLREDEPPTVVDLKRSGNTDLPLHLRIEEVGFSGYQSPWAAGQYTVSAYGDVEIPAGQDRARLSLVMASDKLREADQVSMLRVRSADSTTTQFATLEVQLEDDDQREFESRLPTNTIGFATDQVVVRERDPVVQIDVLRFNPDDSQIVIGYVVSDITAEDGEDYFAPGGHSVSFGPGQRSARLLIPLVQDTEREGDEAFSVELAAPGAEPVPNVYQRIVIMIRDDELAIR